MKAPRLLFAAALLGTLTALIWTEENWRAARDWAACQRDMAARGERLDLSAAYDPIAPERNLARTPLFTHCFYYTVDPASGQVTAPAEVKYRLPQLNYMPWPSAERMTAGEPAPPFIVYQGKRIDLRAWQASSGDVLHALETFAPILDDVERSAAMMPDGVFALAPASHSAGTFVAVRRIAQTLALRASAHLAAGQSAEARHDLELIFWLRRSASEPHRIINAALGCSYLDLSLQIVWEGLADHRWTADDLAAIQRRLAGVDVLAEYRRSLSGQRAECLFLIDGLQEGRYKYPNLFGMGDGWSERVSAWALMHGPSGWLVQNRVALTLFYQNFLLGCVDVPAHRFHPEVLDASLAEAARICAAPVWPWRYLLATGTPSFLRLTERCVLTQTALDEAVVACAIERYALAHGGAEPADLGALAPEYLGHMPACVVDGTPLYYTQTPDGRCRLVAKIPLLKTEKPEGTMVQGDELVWEYPSIH